MNDRALFKYEFPISIRFTDIDIMNHVNNAAYFTFLEDARLHYWQDIIGASINDNLLWIIAHAECDYRRPIQLTEPTKVLIRVPRIGNKSFDFIYKVIVQNGEQEVVAAEGLTVQVMFDYSIGQSVAVPDNIRKALIAFEPGLS